MSLINQMLSDLEQRRRRGEPPPPLPAASGHAAPGRRPLTTILGGLTIATILSSAAWLYLDSIVIPKVPVPQVKIQLPPGGFQPAPKPAAQTAAQPRVGQSPPQPSPSRPAIAIDKIGLATGAERVRLVVTLSAPTGHHLERDRDPRRYRLQLDGVTGGGQPPIPDEEHYPLRGLALSTDPQGTRLDLILAEEAQVSDYGWRPGGDGPFQVVVDITKPHAEEREEEPEIVADARPTVPAAKQLHGNPPLLGGALTFGQAQALIAEGRLNEGEAALRQTLEAGPDHRPARETLAGLMLEQGRISEAARLLRGGLELAPGYPPYAYAYARILVDQGEVRRALEVLDRAEPGGTDAAEIQGFRGALLARLQRPEEAAEAYRLALTAQPDRGAWWLGLGLVLEGLERPGEALASYRRALLDPRVNEAAAQWVERRIALLAESG